MDRTYYLEDLINDKDYIHYNVISQMQAQNQYDALAFILYIVMIECGYTENEMDILPTYNFKRIANILEGKEASSVFTKKENVYNLVLYINKIRCNMDLIIFSKHLIANVSAPEFNILKSKCFSCIRDITNFAEICTVCLDFKNNIAIPVRTLALNEKSIYHACLVGMPYDIQVYLVKHYLKVQDFISLSKTCRTMNNLHLDYGLWFHFCRTNNFNLRAGCENPKAVFKENWVLKNHPNPYYHFDVY